MARIVLSTTGSDREHPADSYRFERTKIEILENGPRLAVGQRPMVTFEHVNAVPEYPIGQGRRRFIEKDEID
jgi:hypothetical protein